ncbi:MAG TPA: hypothetical protein ENN98_06635 [Desulfurivibrio alkaliphilus]|uniref:DUF106 domain-containing protein n=1 Tax=Desulfurivibrio alkaliphilus TaxID=427923 RepID=A0A7C2XQ23_9BACT|nr:hypothetical protein [Desulfurivibrio alkaliphilus]
MDILRQLYIYLDALLIAPFRFFETPIVGFYFGTFVLCAWCILLGELTFRLAVLANCAYMNRIRAEAVKMHNLSIKAIALKDKESYRNCNKQANEAFGKYFFNTITQGAAYLWPVPFALAWMSLRFSQVEFELLFPLPIVGDTLGFAAVPVNIYILSRIGWGRLKPHLYLFNRAPRIGLDQGEEEMISWESLGQASTPPEKGRPADPP